MSYRRLALVLLAIGLIACLSVAVRRERHESRADRVEIVMDDGDFQSLARSYGYDQRSFLIALRRAGLTSLAVQEELGSQLASSPNAVAYSGSSLLNQAKLTGLREPVMQRLFTAGRLRPDEVYVLSWDPATTARYARQLPLKFTRRAVRVLNPARPAVFAVRTQSDFFAATGLGLPADRVALARELGLRLVPRLQNDERLTAPQIRTVLDDAVRRHNAHTVIFFGIRNQVLGYPNQLKATANAMRRRVDFGTIETYDVKQNQAGSERLAQLLPDATVRVQAITKVELDKLQPEEIVQRYDLGVRERNIRVVYLRPFAHQWGNLTIEQTNVALVRAIAQNVRAAHLRVGSASPFGTFLSRPWEIALASLAVPAIVALLLGAFGVAGIPLLLALVAVDVVLVLGGFAVHHDMPVRKLLALIGGIAFPIAGFAAIAPAFAAARAPSTGAAIIDGIRVLAIATLVTLGGALVVVGLLSTPLTMTEIDRFTGVKLVLAVPPLACLLLYLFTPRWGSRLTLRALGESPVTVLPLVVGIALLGIGYLVLARSGNQSDIAPSAIELSLRAHLTTLLAVRPRFKEFVVGFPALMLVPALLPAHRARWGWLLALAIGIGLADVVDTFSHLHTALAVSVLRLVNGAVLGIVIGALVVVVYRSLSGARERSIASVSRRERTA